MSTDNELLLPENDPDLVLARRIGLFLEQPAQAGSSGDALEAVLAGWKRHRDVQSSVYHVDSDALWARIESGLTVSEPAVPAAPESAQPAAAPAAPARLFSLKPALIWAAAAAVLLAALVGPLFNRPDTYGPFPDTRAVTLSDGSEILLRKNSTLSVEKSLLSDDVQVSLTGEARFAVAKRKRRFDVEAGGSLVQVTGTVFYVQQSNRGVRVYLEEGAVVLTPSGQPAVNLTPGDVATVPDSQPASITRRKTVRDVTDWTEDKLIFDETPLRDVLPDLALHFGILFDLDERLLQEPLTGELVLGTEAQVLQDLGEALGGRFEIHGAAYRFIPH